MGQVPGARRLGRCVLRSISPVCLSDAYTCMYYTMGEGLLRGIGMLAGAVGEGWAASVSETSCRR